MCKKKAGFTIIELLVVIAIIGILAGLLMPAISAVRRRARETECRNNMKNLGVALIQYQQVFRGYLPAYDIGTNVNSNAYAGSWMELLFKAADKGKLDMDADIFICPTSPKLGEGLQSGGDLDMPFALSPMLGGYGMDPSNLSKGRGYRYANIERPGETVMLYEAEHQNGVNSAAAALTIKGSDKSIASVTSIIVPYVSAMLSGSDKSMHFRHASGETMNILMADGKLDSWTIDAIQIEYDKALVNLPPELAVSFGSMWDNVNDKNP